MMGRGHAMHAGCIIASWMIRDTRARAAQRGAPREERQQGGGAPRGGAHDTFPGLPKGATNGRGANAYSTHGAWCSSGAVAPDGGRRDLPLSYGASRRLPESPRAVLGHGRHRSRSRCDGGRLPRERPATLLDPVPLLLRAAACSAVIKSCAFAPSTRPAGGLLDGGLHPPGGVGAAGARMHVEYVSETGQPV